jgi:hypothetical protein
MTDAERLRLRLKDATDAQKEIRAEYREKQAETDERWNRYKGAAVMGAGGAIVGRHRIGKIEVGLDEIVALGGAIFEPKRSGLLKGAVEAATIRAIGNVAEKGAEAAVGALGLRGRIDEIKAKTGLRAVEG